MSEVAPERPASPSSRGGELIAAASAVVLLVSMFGLQWYGITGARAPFGPGSAVSGAQSAWRALTALRWLMLLTILVGLGSMILRGRGPKRRARGAASLLVTVLGGATALLLLYRVLVNPPSPSSIVDQKLGAFLGLLGAVGVALGGHQSWREARESAAPGAPGARA